MIVAFGRQAVENASMHWFATKSTRNGGVLGPGIDVQCRVAKFASADTPLEFSPVQPVR